MPINQDQPLVSVYIPTHNRRELLERAINSVLNQTYKNVEILICDDGSTDGTEEFINDLKSNHKNIIYLKSRTPMGACSARNIGIKAAQGEYITGLDDDDEWIQNRLELFLANRNRLDEYSFLYSDDIVMDEKNGASWKYPKPMYDFYLFSKKNIIGNQIFTKADRFKNCQFDLALSAAQDYDVFYRMVINYGKPYKIESITQKIYINYGAYQISSSNRKFYGYYNFYRKHCGGMDIASRRFQLFSLYEIRRKKMSIKTIITLMSVRNFKKTIMKLF